MGKKYCIFAAQFLPHMGGVERYTYNLGKKLIEKGNEVVVVTSETGGMKNYEKLEGIEIFRFPCWNFIGDRYPVLKLSKIIFEITHKLEKRKFDLVIVNTRFYIHSLYGQIFAKKNGLRCITIDHGTSHLSVHNPFADFIGGVYEHVITKVGQLFCKDYFGVSEACNEWLLHFHIRAKGVLYNAVDLEAIEQLKKNIVYDFRKQNEIPPDAIVVSFTGRLLKEKGLYQMIEAVERINEQEAKIYLMIAGDGEEAEFVQSHASKYIYPLGRLDFPEVIALLVQSDIFCLPSFSEGFSTAALEAAACGCYIITTKRGGTKELVINSEYGIVMKDNHANYIYEALLETMGNESRRKKATELCYNRLKEKFTWDSIVEKVERL